MKRSTLARTKTLSITASEFWGENIVPDVTPGMISRYALSDEQALLAKIRHNRLLDFFTGFICYSLQTHLKTTIPGIGQVETDELYIGIDRRGGHYVLTVQATGKNKKIRAAQIKQDMAVAAIRFPKLIAHHFVARFMEKNLIALFELEQTREGIRISSEKHYKLVPSENL